MVKPTPMYNPLWVAMAVFIPMTWPLMLTSGPPELPGLMGRYVRLNKILITYNSNIGTPCCAYNAVCNSAAQTERIADGNDYFADTHF